MHAPRLHDAYLQDVHNVESLLMAEWGYKLWWPLSTIITTCSALVPPWSKVFLLRQKSGGDGSGALFPVNYFTLGHKPSSLIYNTCLLVGNADDQMCKVDSLCEYFASLRANRRALGVPKEPMAGWQNSFEKALHFPWFILIVSRNEFALSKFSISASLNLLSMMTTVHSTSVPKCPHDSSFATSLVKNCWCILP